MRFWRWQTATVSQNSTPTGKSCGAVTAESGLAGSPTGGGDKSHNQHKTTLIKFHDFSQTFPIRLSAPRLPVIHGHPYRILVGGCPLNPVPDMGLDLQPIPLLQYHLS